MRRNKNSQPSLNLDEVNTRNRYNMPVNWVKRFAVKKVVLIFVLCFIVWKIFQIWLYSGVPKDLPPEHIVDKPIVWRYKTNPQGISEDYFNEIMSRIDLGDRLVPTREVNDDELETIESSKSLVLPKVEKTYRSSGSLTFKAGEFYLDGKAFRILSGAMHYFRVVPEYWRDRLKKMKACGLNTVET